jgi:hypothetical protein
MIFFHVKEKALQRTASMSFPFTAVPNAAERQINTVSGHSIIAIHPQQIGSACECYSLDMVHRI